MMKNIMGHFSPEPIFYTTKEQCFKKTNAMTAIIKDRIQ